MDYVAINLSLSSYDERFKDLAVCLDYYGYSILKNKDPEDGLPLNVLFFASLVFSWPAAKTLHFYLYSRRDDYALPALEEFQVGWICVLHVEAAAAKEMLDEDFGILQEQNIAGPNLYTLERIGMHYVVIACLPAGQYGTTSATNVANNIVRSFFKS